MPCHSMRTTTVTLEGREPAILAAALITMGYQVRLLGNQVNFSGYNKAGAFAEGSYISGKLRYQGQVDLVEVKQSYAAEVVKATYDSPNWDLTFGVDADGNQTVEAEYKAGAW